jgi:hypothetical protein
MMFDLPRMLCVPRGREWHHESRRGHQSVKSGTRESGAALRTERSSPSLWGLARGRLLSVRLVVGMLMVSLTFSAGLDRLGRWWHPRRDGWTTVAYTSNVTGPIPARSARRRENRPTEGSL